MEARTYRYQSIAIKLMEAANLLKENMEAEDRTETIAEEQAREDDAIRMYYARLALGEEQVKVSQEHVSERMRLRREADKRLLEDENRALRHRVAIARESAARARNAVDNELFGITRAKQQPARATQRRGRQPSPAEENSAEVAAPAAADAEKSIDAAATAAELARLRRELWSAQADVKKLRERDVALQGVVVSLLPPRRADKAGAARK